LIIHHLSHFLFLFFFSFPYSFYLSISLSFLSFFLGFVSINIVTQLTLNYTESRDRNGTYWKNGEKKKGRKLFST
jgi:hypothetical protein